MSWGSKRCSPHEPEPADGPGRLEHDDENNSEVKLCPAVWTHLNVAAAEQFQASQLGGQSTFSTQAKADQQQVSAWSAAFEKVGGIGRRGVRGCLALPTVARGPARLWCAGRACACVRAASEPGAHGGRAGGIACGVSGHRGPVPPQEVTTGLCLIRARSIV